MIPLRWLPRICLIFLALLLPFSLFLDLLKPLFDSPSEALMPLLLVGMIVFIIALVVLFFWSLRRWPLKP